MERSTKTEQATLTKAQENGIRAITLAEILQDTEKGWYGLEDIQVTYNVANGTYFAEIGRGEGQGATPEEALKSLTEDLQKRIDRAVKRGQLR